MSIELHVPRIIALCSGCTPSTRSPALTRECRTISPGQPCDISIGCMGFKTDIKYSTCNIFDCGAMLGMDCTPGSTIPDKSIQIGTCIYCSKHDLIRRSSRVGSEPHPVYNSTIICIRDIGDSTQCRTRISTVTKESSGHCSKSPSKHDISRSFFIRNINGLFGGYRGCCFPRSRRTHIIPGTACPSHTINI